jgi:glycine/D-amino acid oxidase-like deaminating enzyme/nitrite reductase/ring-hydroxylating ferredoxin subunit
LLVFGKDLRLSNRLSVRAQRPKGVTVAASTWSSALTFESPNDAEDDQENKERRPHKMRDGGISEEFPTTRKNWRKHSWRRVLERAAVDKPPTRLTFAVEERGMPNYTNPVWSEVGPAPARPRLEENLEADVAIVGGGITGITTAALLTAAGRRVVVLEARRIGKGETFKTTAHLTEALDVRYHRLESRFGEAGAKLAAEGQRAAIDRIARFVQELSIACDFRRVPGFLFAERPEEVKELGREAEIALKLGIRVALTDTVPLPFPTRGALRFEDQATIQPRTYLQALTEAVVAQGGQLFENTQVTAIDEGDPCRIVTERGVVTARAVVVAAHVPVSNRLLLHTKLAAYRSYAVGIEMPFPTDALFWDLGDPYHYIRRQRVDGRDFLIVGGEDHKVGEAADTTEPFKRLEAYVEDRFNRQVAPTDYRWAGQIIESADGLPYVGLNSASHHVYVATGYSGNGITGGTLAAMVLSEQIQGRQSRWDKLLDATRFKPLASAKAFVSENVDFPKHLLKDRLPLPGAEALEKLEPGEGNVLSLGGRRLAVYRNGNGELSALSPVCTHLGCLVHWNNAEKSWDCPCHGSRFDPHGRVLNGPAVIALEAKPLPQDPQEPQESEESEESEIPIPSSLLPEGV